VCVALRSRLIASAGAAAVGKGKKKGGVSSGATLAICLPFGLCFCFFVGLSVSLLLFLDSQAKSNVRVCLLWEGAQPVKLKLANGEQI
jgi:hypothetical protein